MAAKVCLSSKTLWKRRESHFATHTLKLSSSYRLCARMKCSDSADRNTYHTCQTTLCGLSGLYGIVRRDLYVSNVSVLLQMALEIYWERMGTFGDTMGTYGDVRGRMGTIWPDMGAAIFTALVHFHNIKMICSADHGDPRRQTSFGSINSLVLTTKTHTKKNVFSSSIMGKETSFWSQLMASQLTRSFPVCHLSSCNTRMWISSVNDCFLADFEALTFARFWGTFGDTRGRTQM